MSEFLMSTIGEVATKIVGGGTPSRKQDEHYKGKIPWITVKDLSNSSFYKNSAQEHINENAVKNSAATLVPKGKVIIATRMGLGKGFINLVPMAINQDMKALFLKEDRVNPVFFLHWYIGSANKIVSLGAGSTVQGISVDTLKTVTLPLPSLKEQTKIAEILSSVDEVIELTEKEIEKLQMLKKGMMQDLLTKGIGHTKFKDSPVGRIPESWDVNKLGTLIKVSSGSGLSQQNMKEGKCLVYGGNGINGYHDDFTHDEGQLIIGRVGAYCGNIHITKEKSWITDNALTVKFLNSENQKFWYFKLGHLNFNSFCFTGAQPVITGGIIYPIIVATPKFQEQQEIANILENLSSNIRTHERKLEINKFLKNALMSDLLTGKVRVKV